uniref:CMRF35-like molecule 8 isoform X2 n=1 Tax=Jaculus jaculus TaxID=51337 RepID=UPI001E1B1958|nr:CMRF35-like molecule 8 isoform X2 [Jaculus jaculus]
MTPGAWAVWPPFLLLLLWLPGCFPLSSLSPVTGYVGRALSVQCQYEEDHRLYSKYWCRESMLGVRCNKIVETEVSKRELRKDRVSITDHPTNLTFKVTLEHLTLEDAGAYRCGINLPWSKDLEFQVVVYVLPTKTLTTRTEVQATLSTSSAAKSPTQGSSPEERPRDFQGQSIWPLLSVLALLLLLLMGASLLAWWRIQKRIKADKHPELSENLRQAAEQSDPQYVNLQLHMLSLREEPVPPRQVDTEYSTVTLPKDDLHYASVVFDSQKPTCNASEDPTRGSQGGEPEYSVIRKPTAGPSDPHQRLL